MKKTISLILVLIMCLSLCACGKCEEVKAAEELIATIGEITLDNTDAINNARDAFSALSDEEKEKVENAEVLYDSMFTSIALRCKAMNTGSDLVAEWYLASSTFVEFATNPSGNRNDYTSDIAEFNSNVLKFQKEADLMN